MKTLFPILGIVILSVAMIGCGGTQSTGPNIPAGASEAIAETHALLLESTYGGAPIKSAKDLEQYSSRFSKSVKALKSGEVKMVWGKQILDNAKAPQVIAYEAKAESGEGFAIKEDGKLYKVTAADLPKAK